MQSNFENTCCKMKFDVDRFVSADGISRRGLAAAQPLLEGAVAVTTHQIVFLEPPDLCHRSPDSGELPYTSRESRTALWSHTEGWLNHTPFWTTQWARKCLGSLSAAHCRLPRGVGSNLSDMSLPFPQEISHVPAGLPAVGSMDYPLSGYARNYCAVRCMGLPL